MLNGVPLPPRESLTDRGREFTYPKKPRLMRVANTALAPVAGRLWRLEPQALKAKARKVTGLSDFGDDAPLDEPLEILCRSLAEDTQINPMGRLSVYFVLLRNLINRLRLEDFAKRHPEVFERPVQPPIVVIGMPRSGTTFLQRLIAQDPGIRSLPFWELFNPLPPGNLDEPVPDPDPRIAEGAKALRFTYWRAPDLRFIHEMENETPDEEIPLLSMGFAAPLFEYMALVPQFVEWYLGVDHTDGYRYFHRLLQAMQHLRPAGERFVLKSPSHLEMLKPLLTAFPDATVVQTHRDPVTSVISLSSLVTYGQRANFNHPNPHLVGRLYADFVERLLRASVTDRPENDPRFVDVHFRPLIADPLAQLRRVYDTAGLNLTEPVRQRMLAWIDRDDEQRVRHDYSAADFGLDVERLRERFAFYYERFDVPKEPQKPANS